MRKRKSARLAAGQKRGASLKDKRLHPLRPAAENARDVDVADLTELE
jgi:hypothetical protein